VLLVALIGGFAALAWFWWPWSRAVLTDTSAWLAAAAGLRLLRVVVSARVAWPRAALDAWTVVDLAYLYAIGVTHAWALRELALAESPFSIGFVVGLPLLYVLVTSYVLVFFLGVDSRRVRIAQWLLTAYAFPESLEHRAARPPARGGTALEIGRVVEWSALLMAVALLLLLGFRLDRYPLLDVYRGTLVLLTTLVVIIFRWSLRRKTVRVPVWMQFAYLAGVAEVVFWANVGVFGNYGGDGLNQRFGRAVGFAMLPAVATIVGWMGFRPVLTTYVRRLAGHRLLSLARALLSLGRAVRTTAYGGDGAATGQAIAVGMVLVVYGLTPHMGPGLKWAGLDEIAGRSVDDILVDFQALARSWSVPSLTSGDVDLTAFFFGNQGLVLVVLMWSVIGILSFAMLSEHLTKVPRATNSRWWCWALQLHFPPFLIVFLPLLLVATLAVPILLAFLMGEAAAIVLSLLGIGLVVPRMLALLLSLGYLATFTLGCAPETDAVDVNSADEATLELLPGIGPRLAARIVEARPFRTLDALESLPSLGGRRYAEIRDLVRASPLETDSTSGERGV